MGRLSRDFLARDTLTVAREPLGQRLVRVLGGKRLSGRIVEVEAYIGEQDTPVAAAPPVTRQCMARLGRPTYSNGHARIIQPNVAALKQLALMVASSGVWCPSL
nr:hypothetical protein [Anaerolineae bacterium]